MSHVCDLAFNMFVRRKNELFPQRVRHDMFKHTTTRTVLMSWLCYWKVIGHHADRLAGPTPKLVRGRHFPHHQCTVQVRFAPMLSVNYLMGDLRDSNSLKCVQSHARARSSTILIVLHAEVPVIDDS